jgi:hypothetical protein
VAFHAQQRTDRILLIVSKLVLAVLVVGSALAACSSAPQVLPPVPGSSSGWVAHSAYGLQLSVPKSWAVFYFGGNCPDTLKPGTLAIGTSPTGVIDYCQEIPPNTNQVSITYENLASISASHPRAHPIGTVHGLQVVELSDNPLIWRVADVLVSGSGPIALAVMRTLAPATRSALPAPGIATGTAVSGGPQPVPITGSIRYTRLDHLGHTLGARSVQAFGGKYSAMLAPGLYSFQAKAGSAVCPAVSVAVVSGRTVAAPPITCHGD